MPVRRRFPRPPSPTPTSTPTSTSIPFLCVFLVQVLQLEQLLPLPMPVGLPQGSVSNKNILFSIPAGANPVLPVGLVGPWGPEDLVGPLGLGSPILGLQSWFSSPVDLGPAALRRVTFNFLIKSAPALH